MKIVIFFSAFLFLNCSGTLLENNSENIAGKWTHAESYSSNGAQEIKSGKIEDFNFEFDEKGNFKERLSSKSLNGNYSFHNSVLHLNYKPTDSPAYFQVELSKNKMTLQPVMENGALICDEGCSSVFKRD